MFVFALRLKGLAELADCSWMVFRSVLHRAISPENQPCSADLIARSMATHAIILE